LPRRYRPPARRRRSRKERPLPERAAPLEASAAAPVSSPRPAAAPVAVRQDRSTQTRHIVRDHRYVLDDVRRVALIVVFIVGGLVITAILR
jgi:hypothetical protein